MLFFCADEHHHFSCFVSLLLDMLLQTFEVLTVNMRVRPASVAPPAHWLTAVWPFRADLYVFWINHLVDLPNPFPAGISSLLPWAQIF